MGCGVCVLDFVVALLFLSLQDTAERELADIKDEMQMLKQKRQNRRESAVDGALPPPNDPALEMKRSSTKADDNNKSQSAELATRLAESDEANQKLKRQMLHIVTESNKRHTELQNQLQGMDMV